VEVIRFDRSGSAVSFRVVVVGLVVWRYRYEADGAIFTRKASQGDPPAHALGTPEGLNGDVNGWDVHVVSPDDRSQHYQIELVWSQDSREIHKWTRQGKVNGDAPRSERGEAFLLAAP
jgi:hypothetical protein